MRHVTEAVSAAALHFGFFSLLAFAVGCGPTVGGTSCTEEDQGPGVPPLVRCARTETQGCNEAAERIARTVVYRACDGAPAFVGQALILDNCSSCHAEATTDRLGAPAGLDFDPYLVADNSTDPVGDAQLLLRAQNRIHRHRDSIYQQTVDGAMPPSNFARASTYRFRDGSPVPSIRDGEAHELLRHWLSCGSPVIESTVNTASSCSSGAECIVTNYCDTSSGTPGVCVGVGDIVAPGASGSVEPNWDSIWCRLDSQCASSNCHGSPTMAGGLALLDSASAYRALRDGMASSSSACSAGRLPYIAPSNPDGSLLVDKIEAAPSCGARMPIGPTLSDDTIAAIRTWIENGAPQSP